MQVIIGDDFVRLWGFAFVLVFFLFAGIINAAYIDDISTQNIGDVDYFENDADVSLKSINFTIPAGFGLIENESDDFSKGDLNESELFYVNGENDIIMISTSPIVRHDLILSDYTPCDVDMNCHSINGHDGIEWSMDNGTYFIYFDNDSIVTVGSSNGSYLEDIIQ